MNSYYTIEWQSFAGASMSSGCIEKFASLEDAQQELLRQKREHAAALESQPLADTYFRIVRLEVDEYGNQTEVPIVSKCVLYQEYFGTRPNVSSFESSYAALVAYEAGTLGFTPYEVELRPARDGSYSERMKFADWLTWVKSQN